MTTLSIGKTIAPALLVGAASVAAIGYAVTQLPRYSKVESAPAAVMSQPVPVAKSAAAGTAAPSADTASPKSAPPPALASTESKVAALSADLGTAPAAPGPAADPSLPAFDVARVEAGGDAVIAGRAAPGATIDLMRGNERLDRAVADASGQFVMVPPHLPAGSYELSLNAKLPDGSMAQSKQGVTVTVKEADASTGSIAARTEPAAGPVLEPQEKVAAVPSRQAMAAATPSDDGTAAAKGGASSGGTRMVVRGDSLWRISRLTYGAGEQYAVVYRANRDRIKDPNLIHPGQVLVLPIKHR
jgi:nucleoid-associated protein YgaU